MAGRSSPSKQRHGPRRFMWWYDAIIDLMLANPDFTQNEIAKRLGCTAPWLSSIVNSDTFKLHYAHRRQGLSDRVEQTVAGEIQGLASEVAIKSLDLVLDKLDRNPEGVAVGEALETADRMLNRLGYGPKAGPSTTVVAERGSRVAVISNEDFERARSRIRSTEAAKLVPLPAPDRVSAVGTQDDDSTEVLNGVAPAPA